VKLNELQFELERIYDVSTPHRVEDFLLEDPIVASQLLPQAACDDCAERLLVAQGEDSVDVTLFLHRAVLARLRKDNPAQLLHAGNLQDFWFALEGVSHFLYLAWNAAFQRPITAFEMELVAEVDKFVATAALLQRQRGSVALRPLRRILFEAIRFRSNLDEGERQRYHEANRLASRYCGALEARYGQDPEDPELIRELRRFYRMSRDQKIHHIEGGPPRSL
jgi:hypothetical protein